MKTQAQQTIGWLGTRAFTRSELVLVVATTVFLLATMAMAGRQAWRESKRTVCGNQLRVISQGFLQFSSQDGRLPQAARIHQPKPLDWIYWQLDREFESSALAPFCPDWRLERLQCPLDTRWADRSYLATYTMNGYTERALVRDMGPPGKILVAEQERPNDGCWGPGLGEEPLTRRHQGQAGVAFGDGHVQFIRTDLKEER
jgi:prepilin-type processing-associated H-X9-DG protein